jgi:hypothetical protein
MRVFQTFGIRTRRSFEEHSQKPVYRGNLYFFGTTYCARRPQIFSPCPESLNQNDLLFRNLSDQIGDREYRC